MFKALLSALLLSCVSFAQAAPSATSKASEPPAAAEVPATAPVITLAGFCPDAPAGTDSKSPTCKTVITKAEFEKLVDTLNPKMPPQMRQNIAGDYAKMLVFSDQAKKRGLENTDRFKLLVNFVTMEVAAQELIHSMQEQAKPSDAEVAKYYQENAPKYEEISLKRVFIPRNSPNAKPTDPKPTDEQVKAEGEKVRARLAAGEDFEKVQKEVYTAKGYKIAAPPTSIPNMRRDTVPPSQLSLFDRKPGELSQIIVEPAGAYIYRVEEKKTIPLETVKPEIEAQLTNQKLRADMETLTSSIKPELNEAYFRSFSAPAPGVVGPAAPGNLTVKPSSGAQSGPSKPPSLKK